MKNILIVGATSAIAAACARRWCEGGARFYLVGRSADKLRQVADDLSARGADGWRTICLPAAPMFRPARSI